MCRFGEELARSAREALAIARGELEPARTYVVEGRRVRTVLTDCGLLADQADEAGPPTGP